MTTLTRLNTNLFSTKKVMAFCFLLMLMAASCKNDSTTATATDTNAAAIPNKTLSSDDVKQISGVLDTLWVDSSAFANLSGNKLVLQYYIGNDDTLTLHGWSSKLTGGFNTPPSIKLSKGRKSDLKYGPGSYFGDLVLKDINKIQKALKDNKSKYVLFAPKMDGLHIKYDIFVSTDNPAVSFKDFLFAPTPTDAIANPSPPRNF